MRFDVRARMAVAALAVGALLAAWLLRSGGGTPGGSGGDAESVSNGDTVPGSARPRDALPPVRKASPTPPAEAIPPAAPRPGPEPARRVVLEGRVVGLRGEPVAGATVCLMRPPSPDPGLRSPVPLSDRVQSVLSLTGGELGNVLEVELASVHHDQLGEMNTGDDGTFRFEVSPRASAGLIAWGGGHANTMVRWFSLLEDVRGVVLRFEPAGAVTGRVLRLPVGPDEVVPVPLPGASVRLLLPRGEGEEWVALGEATTDKEGRFRQWGWPPGTYTLLVEAGGFRRTFVAPVAIPGDDRDILMTPAAFATLRGVVLLPDGSTPAAKARVRAITLVAGEPAIVEATTDEEGKYRFDRVEMAGPGIRTSLRIEVDAGERGVGGRTPPGWLGDSDEWITLLAPGATLRGRVVDARPGEGGKGVAGVLLEVRGLRGEVPVCRPITTGHDGSFEAKGLPDREVRVSAAPGETGWEFARGPLLHVPDRVEGSEWEVVIEVFPRSRISGVVYAPDGSPAAGAKVDVASTAAGAPGALTGPDGRFVLHGVPAVGPPLNLRAEKPGFAPAWSGRLSLTPGSSLEGVVLSLPAALVPLAGRVLDEEGNPAPGAVVTVSPNEGGSGGANSFRGVFPMSLAGPAGLYRIEVPTGARWTVKARLPGCAPAESEPVLAGDPVPDLILRKAAPAERK